MKFLPFEKFIIESKKSEFELTSCLYEQMEPNIYFRLDKYLSDEKLKPYEGEIESNSFTINRIIKHKNPFLPKIKGEFKVKNDGSTKIVVKIRVRYLPLIFVVFWSITPMLLFFKNSVNKIELTTAIFISILPALIGYLFIYLSFNPERKKSKKFLTELFKD